MSAATGRAMTSPPSAPTDELHIEVKTTNLGVRTPFHITRWEVEVSSRERATWSLFRLFDFKSDPRMYRLDGSVEESARLEPSVFVGVPR